ncbi:L,D-transpeptidase catalytic domain [Prevotella sp. KH2C16]|nr:L,D-transpeptidase family protein [Prevotella sp. KH2C16]SFF98412.1 L,D-transpeptidase catalytic domain [Prevotella sp. KH2C16]
MVVVAAVFASCRDHAGHPYQSLTLDSYSDIKVSEYKLNSTKIQEEINRQIRSDVDSLTADFRARSYYLRKKPWLWINRMGVDHRADTLLSFLDRVDELGFSKSKFRVQKISADLQRFRNLDFDTMDNEINKVLGRLEYNLTKAYLRYATGQRFGFINPKYIFNKLDVHDSDSVHVSYRGLFAIPMQHPKASFFDGALRKVYNDSISEFLHAVQPRSPLYKRLLARLNNPETNMAEKPKIMVNMERCRWRLNEYPQQYAKYVLVNVPSFRLRAIDGDSVLSMRIGCGTLETKTPLLSSRIKRMDINPQWIIPRSIIEKSILNHAGDSSYFARHRYFVRDRRTGKTVSPNRISRAVLEDRNFLVIQEGGEGNSLGRIIFRFDNGFSIYLHDTSSRGVFSREDRGVSHGCVRVERPFDLAVFLLEDKDPNIIKRIHYSMHADVSGLGMNGRKDKVQPDTLDRRKVIGSVSVEPQVPVFITYYTLYPNKDGEIEEFSDVYGYDKVIYRYFANYR